MGHGTSNQSSLFQHNVVMLFYNKFILLVPGHFYILFLPMSMEMNKL